MSKVFNKYIVLLNILLLSVGSSFSATASTLSTDIDFSKAALYQNQTDFVVFTQHSEVLPEFYLLDISDENEVNSFLRKVEEFKEFIIECTSFDTQVFFDFEIQKNTPFGKSNLHVFKKNQLYLIYCDLRI